MQGTPGHTEEIFAAGSLAIAVAKRGEGDGLGWSDIGLLHSGGPYAFKDGTYKPCEVYQITDGVDLGVDLVFNQQVGSGHPSIWHINQDIVLALNLIQEGDSWIRPEEGYIEVIRQRRDADGRIVAIEIKSEFLCDYLAVRNMALRLSYYRQRSATVEDASYINWPEDGLEQGAEHDRFKGTVFEIDADGHPFGNEFALFHVSRTDVDPEEDVPVFGPETDSTVAVESNVIKREGAKFFRIEGELWRDEWLEPANRSERVRRDDPIDQVSYVVDAQGARLASSELNDEDIGRYLWFDPKVMLAAFERRGGRLKWYTRETGSVSCSPDSPVHFGVNRLGLINTYAYDVAKLPQWQQRIWAGHNVAPDGQVSEELLAAQMRVRPARTVAPEVGLGEMMDALDALFQERFGGTLFRSHQAANEILGSVHRFRAIDRNGLLALAKDTTRVVVDRIDTVTLRKIVLPPKDEKWGSLKFLENAIATMLPLDQARKALTPLVAIYELRLGDAHLPSSEIDNAFAMVGLDVSAPFVQQGKRLLQAAVNVLITVYKGIRTEVSIYAASAVLLRSRVLRKRTFGNLPPPGELTTIYTTSSVRLRVA